MRGVGGGGGKLSTKRWGARLKTYQPQMILQELIDWTFKLVHTQNETNRKTATNKQSNNKLTS